MIQIWAGVSTLAGDLFSENITYNQRATLLEAGATDSLMVFHGDKPWTPGALDGRHNSPSRVGLPAHGYITFKGGDGLKSVYKTDQIARLKLDDCLKRFSRPSFLSQKQSLQNWPGQSALSAVQMLEAALAGGSIVLEYYKYDGTALAEVFTEWPKVPE